METIEIEWVQYNNFFDLWRNHKEDSQLLYVIGDQHHCYVGSIGGNHVVKGLGVRYQWQYVDRAKSIFGQDESAGQVAYAGLFRKPKEINSKLILAAEAFIQNHCTNVLMSKDCLFQCKKLAEEVKVINRGRLPQFLN